MEVKGPGDQLRPEQREWLTLLPRWGFLPALPSKPPAMLTGRLSVGHLVQTLYRQGGLFDRRSLPLAPLEGLRVQQRYQASKGADYEREVRLAGTFPQGALELRLGGRADGVLRRADGWMVEEIKSYGGTLGEAQEDLELHRAQLRCYGALLARQAPDCPETLGFCLTYVQASSGAATAVRWEEPTAALDAFLQRSLMAYGAALAGEGARLRARNDALSALVFPLPIPRAGQLALARAAFGRASRERDSWRKPLRVWGNPRGAL